MDIVFIEGLHVDAIIGVYDFERTMVQPLFFDIEMQVDIARAAETDDLAFTVDYAAVSRRVIEHCQATSHQLLEKLVEELAQLIRTEFGVGWLRMKVRKPQAVAEADSVGLLIERGSKA